MDGYEEMVRRFQEKQRNAREGHREVLNHLAARQRAFSEMHMAREFQTGLTCPYCAREATPGDKSWGHASGCPRFTDVYPMPLGLDCDGCELPFTPGQVGMYLPTQHLANVYRTLCLGCAAVELILEVEFG